MASRLQTRLVITCFKSVLLIYAFILWITGVVLLAVGIWGKVSLEDYFFLLNEKVTNVPFVLIGTGTIIFLLGTFGCFATCRASAWMLKLYIVNILGFPIHVVSFKTLQLCHFVKSSHIQYISEGAVFQQNFYL
uniref:Uncharacterized protein n=1 Tax=Prolemur simus TaxID=1328070 RepID=A0A8C9AN19_PROSS